MPYILQNLLIDPKTNDWLEKFLMTSALKLTRIYENAAKSYQTNFHTDDTYTQTKLYRFIF
jgi:hypothetical protein